MHTGQVTPYMSPDQLRRVQELEHELDMIVMPPTPPSSFKLFENKQFNTVKKEMPHLSAREIEDLIHL